MIRDMRTEDLDFVTEIWLESNLEAHAFIPEEYWRGNLEFVKEQMGQAEISVYERDGAILGFLGGSRSFIEGIFVRREARGQGIGKALLDFRKGESDRLTLMVYEQNRPAIRFYMREGFRVCAASVDGETGEKEFEMEWIKEECEDGREHPAVF